MKTIKKLEKYLDDGYKLFHTPGGQIFPRAGWYLEKSKKGIVEDIFYLQELPKK